MTFQEMMEHLRQAMQHDPALECDTPRNWLDVRMELHADETHCNAVVTDLRAGIDGVLQLWDAVARIENSVGREIDGLSAALEIAAVAADESADTLGDGFLLRVLTLAMKDADARSGEGALFLGRNA